MDKHLGNESYERLNSANAQNGKKFIAMSGKYDDR